MNQKFKGCKAHFPGVKIVHVTDLALPHIGGVEYVVHRYSTMQSAEGHESCVITTRLPDTQRAEKIGDVKYIRLSKPGMVLRIPFLLKKFKPDIVHTHSYLSSFTLSYLWKINRRIPILRHIHDVYIGKYEEYSGWEGSRLYEHFEKISITREYSGYITPSRYTKSRLIALGLPAEEIHVVPPGINIEKFKTGNPEYVRRKHGIPEKSKIIGFVGRLSTGKGPQDLIEAARELDAHIILVGPNPNPRTSGILGIEDMLKNMVKKYGMAGRVIFAGKIKEEEVPHYYASFDIFCLPSISEGFGMSIAEALAAGKPVVSYNTTAIPELVKNGYNGFLVEPGDIGALREKLFLLLNDNGLYEKLRKNTRKSVERYTWENSYRILMKVYSRYL